MDDNDGQMTQRYTGMQRSDAEELLRFLDEELVVVQKDARGILLEAFQKYSALRADNTKVGFEELISVELFRLLTAKMQNSATVFYQYPGIERDTIDLFVEHDKGYIYIENKMYYSTSADAYDKDRRKLIAAAGEPNTMCVWTHFQYHKNQNNPQIALFQQHQRDLKAEDFETSLRFLGDDSGPYAIRLAFWDPYREIVIQQPLSPR